jgi:MFS-type transporter involved in bile tolerance (Atg22 family)
LGGQLGPWLVGYLNKKTESFTAGMYVSAALLAASGLVVLCLKPRLPAPGPAAT